jgi:MFS family permease
MNKATQFSLLRERRFLPFFVAQACGAFNDNLFKNVLVILVTYQATRWSTLRPELLANIAAGLFILPFVVFSGLAGQLGERFDRRCSMPANWSAATRSWKAAPFSRSCSEPWLRVCSPGLAIPPGSRRVWSSLPSPGSWPVLRSPKPKPRCRFLTAAFFPGHFTLNGPNARRRVVEWRRFESFDYPRRLAAPSVPTVATRPRHRLQPIAHRA